MIGAETNGADMSKSKPLLKHQSSIVSRIGIALAIIVTLALGTMIISYWLSERADSDALALNIAGSLRMQTFKVVMLSEQPTSPEFVATREKLFSSWQHPVFSHMKIVNSALNSKFVKARQNWLQLEQDLPNLSPTERWSRAQSQVNDIEVLVSTIQQDAEQKVRLLRVVQIFALFTTVFLAAIVLYWLRSRVEQPLTELTRAAHRIGQGDFTCRVEPQAQDELGVLAQTLNKMSDAIASMYGSLQKRVDAQTQALQASNTKLQFLYDMVRDLSIETVDRSRLDSIVQQLQQVVAVQDIELCLLTEQGSRPYLQILADVNHDECSRASCDDCNSATDKGQFDDTGWVYRFQVQREPQHHGVLVVRTYNTEKLSEWQLQLFRSVAGHIAIALSLKQEQEQSRRLVLMQERTVIARELHDSLAQALSYLKIQVTRLNKAIEKQRPDMLQEITDELKQGLDSAYRQLRELLTTFRLKVDGGGIEVALQQAVAVLAEQSGMRFRVDYQLSNIPLSPQEEIHLLQIVREASQNAVHHSKGTEVHVCLKQHTDKWIELCVEDNGVGIPDKAEKLNHYGLAIMQERSRQLQGELRIERRDEGGTGVYFKFYPGYLSEKVPA
jgi:two-component system nitrate/nitrite sensor histidine kinase NarX